MLLPGSPSPSYPGHDRPHPHPQWLLLSTFRLGLLSTVNEARTLLTDLSKAHLLGDPVLGPIKVIVNINHQKHTSGPGSADGNLNRAGDE